MLMRVKSIQAYSLSIVEENPEEAHETCGRLKRVYGRSRELNGLRNWAF